MIEYLGRYTHKVAISNHRITDISEDGTISFTARDRKKERTYSVSLDAIEFLRRFTLHILPPHFIKIRFYGFLSHGNKKAALTAIRTSLAVEPPEPPPTETVTEKMLRLTGIDISLCPKCNSPLVEESFCGNIGARIEAECGPPPKRKKPP